MVIIENLVVFVLYMSMILSIDIKEEIMTCTLYVLLCCYCTIKTYFYMLYMSLSYDSTFKGK